MSTEKLNKHIQSLTTWCLSSFFTGTGNENKYKMFQFSKMWTCASILSYGKLVLEEWSKCQKLTLRSSTSLRVTLSMHVNRLISGIIQNSTFPSWSQCVCIFKAIRYSWIYGYN